MKYDVHCHLEDCEDIDKIVEEAKKNDLTIITDGTNVENNRQAIELAKKYDNVKICLGIYPLEALKLSQKEIDKEIDFIKKNKDIIGVGEVGIDFKEENSKEKSEDQKKTFEKFVKLAIELDKPIFVHSRKAELECIEILEKLKAKRVVMHCFSGNMKLVDRIAANGWMLSIPANITFMEHFQQVVKRVPINQLLCETDSPYLHPRKEWPNNPNNVIESYKKIAEIKELSLKDVEKEIELNVKRIINNFKV